MRKNFKQSLFDGEEAYDPQAWEKLARELDRVMPVQKSTFFNGINIFIISLSTALVGSGIYYYNSYSTASNTNQPNNGKLEVESNKTNKLVSNKKENKTFEKISENKTIQENIVSQIKEMENHVSSESIQQHTTSINSQNSDLKSVTADPEIKFNESKFVAPKFKQVYCLNQEINLSNENESPYELIHENGKLIQKVGANSTNQTHLPYPGKYLVKHKNGENYAFNVSHTGDFEIEAESEVSYENGLPVINLSTSNTTNQLEWSTNKGSISSEQEIKTKLYAFKKGKYTVNLTQIDFNNCKNNKSVEITVPETYNLLAPNAIKPTDSDYRVNKFMPFALTQRNVKFDLYIIDPMSDQIIFKSNSTENAWDGTNQNTGNMVSQNKSFVWKVKIYNPEKGENPEYSGTIVVL